MRVRVDVGVGISVDVGVEAGARRFRGRLLAIGRCAFGWWIDRLTP